MSFEERVSAQLAQIESKLEPLTTGETLAPTVARYQTSAAQTIPNNTPTVVNFEFATFDNRSLVTPGTTWKFTATQPGYYHVQAAVLFAAATNWGAGKAADLLLYTNGGGWSTLDRQDDMTAGMSIAVQLSGGDLIYLASGATLDVRVRQTTGGALALTGVTGFCYVAIHKL